MTPVSCFFSEFIATALLLMVIMAVTDKKNGPPPAGLVPLALFVAVLGITASLGMETSFAINPARDFGPRIFTAMVYGKQVFNFRK
jgi:aquaglyceroporin related protein